MTAATMTPSEELQNDWGALGAGGAVACAKLGNAVSTCVADRFGPDGAVRAGGFAATGGGTGAT